MTIESCLLPGKEERNGRVFFLLPSNRFSNIRKTFFLFPKVPIFCETMFIHSFKIRPLHLNDASLLACLVGWWCHQLISFVVDTFLATTAFFFSCFLLTQQSLVCLNFLLSFFSFFLFLSLFLSFFLSPFLSFPFLSFLLRSFSV